MSARLRTPAHAPAVVPVVTVITVVVALGLAGCGGGGAPSSDGSASATTTSSVTIATNLGEVEVPVDPERVVALDNTSFETLRDWGVTPVALPKTLLPDEGFEDWQADPDILDIGNHREPNLEAVSESEPDLIIGGYRFASYQTDLEKIAQTIDVSPSDDAADGYVASLESQTEALGEVFGKQSEARALNLRLEESRAAAAAATDGQTVFLAVVSGGHVDNGAQRIGRIVEPLDLVDVFEGEGGDVHGDSGLAPETIAQANPDWVIVMDRDAATGQDGGTPAEAVFAAQEAFAGTTFMTQGHVIYLDAYFYTREGIQAYTQAYDQLTQAFTTA